jgi:hypothetical protein
MKKLTRSVLLPVLLLLASQSAVWACSACYGKSDSSMARSLNASIFTLMGVVGVVLAGAASFFVFLAKRAAAMEQADHSSNSPSQPEA